MKKLALVFALALVACNASSENDDHTGDSVSPVTAGPPTEDPKPSTEAPKPGTPSVLPSDPPVSPAPAETCATMREKKAGGELKLEHWDNGGEPWFSDVEARLSSDLLADGHSTSYTIELTFSSVNNLSLYSSFSGHPMASKSLSVKAQIASAGTLDNPWQFEFQGNDGGLVTLGECKNGVASAAMSDGGDGMTIIKIWRKSDTFVEGTFSLRKADGMVWLNGDFKAPIRSNVANSSTDVQQGFAPSKALCCKLQ